MDRISGESTEGGSGRVLFDVEGKDEIGRLVAERGPINEAVSDRAVDDHGGQLDGPSDGWGQI